MGLNGSKNSKRYFFPNCEVPYNYLGIFKIFIFTKVIENLYFTFHSIAKTNTCALQLYGKRLTLEQNDLKFWTQGNYIYYDLHGVLLTFSCAGLSTIRTSSLVADMFCLFVCFYSNVLFSMDSLTRTAFSATVLKVTGRFISLLKMLLTRMLIRTRQR